MILMNKHQAVVVLILDVNNINEEALRSADIIAVRDGDGYATRKDRFRRLGYYATYMDLFTKESPAWRVSSGDRVRHVRKGTTYLVLAIAKLSELPSQEVVVYKADADSMVWARPRPMFEDGRFVLISNGVST
jgi:hypothetical protein